MLFNLLSKFAESEYKRIKEELELQKRFSHLISDSVLKTIEEFEGMGFTVAEEIYLI
ncbi:hypothetical protein MASR1M45_27740 [Candidatus Kapaibacterium sp.]